MQIVRQWQCSCASAHRTVAFVARPSKRSCWPRPLNSLQGRLMSSRSNMKFVQSDELYKNPCIHHMPISPLRHMFCTSQLHSTLALVKILSSHVCFCGHQNGIKWIQVKFFTPNLSQVRVSSRRPRKDRRLPWREAADSLNSPSLNPLFDAFEPCPTSESSQTRMAR